MGHFSPNILFISVFTALLGLGVIAPLMPVYAESMGATGIWIGIIFAGFSISRTIFTPIFGKLSDNRSKKSFITTGMFLLSIISFGYILSNDLYSLTFVRFTHGFASAMIVPIAMAYIGETSSEGEEGTQMGKLNTSMSLGIGFGPIMGGALNTWFGTNSLFIFMAGLTFSAFLISQIFLSDSVKSDSMNPKNKLTLINILRENQAIRGLMLFRAISSLGLGTIYAFFPLLAIGFRLSAFEIGILISNIVLLSAVFQTPLGRFADKSNKIILIMLGSIIVSISLFMITVTDNFLILFVISSFLGIGRATSMPAASALTVFVGRRIGMGSSMGLYSTAMGIGLISSSLISGVVYDFFGEYTVFYLASFITLITLPIIYCSVLEQRNIRENS